MSGRWSRRPAAPASGSWRSRRPPASPRPRPSRWTRGTWTRGDLDAGHDEFQDAHATDTLDYVTILRGHVTLVVGDAEVTLGPGDSVVQQPGVPHDWQNRGEEQAVMVGVLISAR